MVCGMSAAGEIAGLDASSFRLLQPVSLEQIKLEVGHSRRSRLTEDVYTHSVKLGYVTTEVLDYGQLAAAVAAAEADVNE